jgi:hypothetical protein
MAWRQFLDPKNHIRQLTKNPPANGRIFNCLAHGCGRAAADKMSYGQNNCQNQSDMDYASKQMGRDSYNPKQQK